MLKTVYCSPFLLQSLEPCSKSVYSFLGADLATPTIKNIANIIENPPSVFIYDDIYPPFINSANALNGFLIASTNTPIEPRPLSFGAGIFKAVTIGTINTMAINSHSIAKTIKYFLFLLIAPSTL